MNRRGGRMAAPLRKTVTVDTVPAVDDDELHDHLADAHAFPDEVLDAHDSDAWAVWHDGEHATRHPRAREPMHAGHLRHKHEKA